MKKILVALDGSTREKSVLEGGVKMASALGASLVLLRVVGLQVDLPLDLVRVSPAEFEVVLQQRAKDAVAALAKQVIPAGVEWDVQVVTGAPWDAIGWVAKAEDADLIVIGAHGYGRLDRVMGTTASRVVNHADRSVLVIRNEARLETTEKKS